MPKATELYLMPPPCQRLTRDVALSWLLDWSGLYIHAVSWGLRQESADVRESYSALACDAENLTAACARVIDTGKPERIASVWKSAPLERPDILTDLARIASTEPSQDDVGSAVDVYAVLSKRLVELLAEREAA